MITRAVSTGAAIVHRGARSADFAAPAVGSGAIAATTAHVGVCTLALAAPFELLRPLVRLPWQSVSNLEAVLAVVFCAWLWSLVSSATAPRWRTPLTYPWMALLAVMIVSAVMAPAGRINALHMAGRLTIGFALFLLTVNGIDTPARLRRAMAAAVVAGVLVGLLAILEYLQVNAVLHGLRTFRPAMAVVGGQMRAGGTLQYPTIASMYLEIVFALGLGLLLSALETEPPARGRLPVALLFVGMVVIAEAIALTFTRAGLLTMAASLALVGTVRYSRRGIDAGVRLVAVLAFLIPIMFAASRSTESMWLRLTSEGQDTWYRFAVDAPADLTLTTGTPTTVPIRATNKGRLTWDSNANPSLYFSYHWLLADADRVVAFEGARTAFPEPVPPGATVSLRAQVRPPGRPGRYRLQWDLVQEDRLWFSTEPGAEASFFSSATVIGPPTGNPSLTTYALPRRAVRPGRMFLWRAAARMVLAHPVFGVGPDNFRLLYGEFAGLPYADPRLHSNSMYVEMLVGGGLVGGLAFLWLMWRVVVQLVTTIRLGASAGLHGELLGAAAAVVAILIHGTVDSFLSFTPTYILISLALGFALQAV